MRFFAALLVASVMMAIGCAGGTSEPAESLPPPTTTPAPAPPSAPPRSEALQEGGPEVTETPTEAPVLVVYSRSGGIAGAQETLNIHKDGQLHFHSSGREPLTLRIDEARIEHLRSLVESPAFFELQDALSARGADLITYTIMVRRDEGMWVITAMDGADWPPHLRQVIGELNLLREAAVMQRPPQPPRTR